MKVSFQSRDPHGLRMRKPAVVITSMAGGWRRAIEDALGRAARTLVRAWQRNRDQGRSAQRALVFDAPDRQSPGRNQADQRLRLGATTVVLIRKNQ